MPVGCWVSLAAAIGATFGPRCAEVDLCGLTALGSAKVGPSSDILVQEEKSDKTWSPGTVEDGLAATQVEETVVVCAQMTLRQAERDGVCSGDVLLWVGPRGRCISRQAKENQHLTIGSFIDTCMPTFQTPSGPAVLFELYSTSKVTREAAGLTAQVWKEEHPPCENVFKIELVRVVKATTHVARVAEMLSEGFQERLRRIGKGGFTDKTFWPNDMLFPITISFPQVPPTGDHAALLSNVRRYLGLGTVQPYFAPSCAMAQKWAIPPPHGLLRSPHKSTALRRKGHGLQGDVQKAVVHGDFDYYHYNTGDEQDAGWGCAYRSLQMVASWFQLNGYTMNLPPTVARIQAILVDMAVMDSRFAVGCKQWIGSQEVGWVLSSVINSVETRFLFSTGSELITLVRDLEEHFASFGAPVVCCGGNLALTIIGVAWDRDSGKAKFLIADPHYVGEDSIVSAVEKVGALTGGIRAAGVAWRDPSNAFKSKASYTLVLAKVESPNA